MIDIKRAIRLDRGNSSGQMAFWDATLGKWTYTETSELFFDDTNKRVGIGTASPNNTLQVANLISFDDTLFNTALGTDVLKDNTSGDYNVGVGIGALENNTTGTRNVGLGRGSLQNNTEGGYNMAIGYQACNLNTTGNRNVGVGSRSVRYNITGSDNVGLGYLSLEGTSGNSFSSNIGIGTQTGMALTTGSNNVLVGAYSGSSLTSGGSNIFIGNSAGFRQTTLSNILMVDNTIRADIATEATNAILYGTMASTPASQSLRINAEILGTYGAKIGDGGTTNYAEIKADGEINLHGTARVYNGIWLDPTGMKAPGTKPATYVDHGITGAWEFSDGTDDTLVFNMRRPDDLDTSVAPTLLIGWSTSTTATDETCVWQLEYLYTSEGDDTTAGATETLTIDSNAIAQANGLIFAEITGINLVPSDNVCMHCRLKRLGADADDDLTDTAELSGVCFRYVKNKLGIAL